MKLMTYNILNGAIDKLEEVINVINTESPDFLGINEANGFDQNNNQILKEFAARTHFPYFDLAKCGDGDDYHVAVFSKFPFELVEHLEGFARAAIAVTIKTDIGSVSIVATHLTPYAEDLRLKEVDKITSYQASAQHRVLMGDLNSLSEADEYDPAIIFAFNAMQTKKFTAKERLLFDATNMLAQAGYVDPAELTGDQKTFTAPTSINEFKAHSDMRLDYILLSEGLKPRLQNYRVIQNEITETASDHYPVVAELV